MSANKYANLPDIDTAPDVYETEDVFPSSSANQGDSSDEESGLPTRATRAGKNGDVAPGKEELDHSRLISADEASKRFRKAERRRPPERSIYKHPRSRTPSPTPTHPPSLALRLRLLQNEIATLESDMSDPSNPLLQKDREEAHVDPGDLIKGLVDVKSRLEKITSTRDPRTRLVQDVLQDGKAEVGAEAPSEAEPAAKKEMKSTEKEEKGADGVKPLAELDRRVGDVERLVGSASASLDETEPMPPPLLPLLTRLNTQLTVLTQPRHLDNISRRLKLLLTDLDRLSSANQQHRRQQSTHADGSAPAAAPSTLHEQLSPVLTRLVPALPHIPHVLARLRTLAALHTSAAEFQSALAALEEEQRRARETLADLGKAVDGVEASLEENAKVVKGNVGGLDERIMDLVKRLEQVLFHVFISCPRAKFFSGIVDAERPSRALQILAVPAYTFPSSSF
ncbi:hypothetical protein FA95DRAFT_1528961 [Auriscalpium vulgare]|uniref:Uncharacterized protein n=1 Tax=Auriscalpium vulgare TaxID=40419 RepID=A0ACB8R4G8_9AGAM|nr:hypothetical protein FA95DRAFT_1528961 [Auriscalpium vulgare]